MQGVLFLTLNSAYSKTRKAKEVRAPSSQENAIALRFPWSHIFFSGAQGSQAPMQSDLLTKAQEAYKSEVHPKVGTQSQASSSPLQLH